jgi:DNA-binding CsgD family transcriptional regulator
MLSLFRRLLPELVDRVYDAAVDPKAWIEFIELLERALDGASVMLALPFPEPSRPGSSFAPSLEPELVSSCGRGHPALLRCIVGAPVGSLVQMEPAGTWFGEHHASEWCAKDGSWSARVGIIDRDDEIGTSGLVVWLRREPAVPLEEVWRLLMPALQRVARIHYRTAHLRSMRGVLAGLPVGVIVLDAGGRVRATSRAADRLLGARDGLSLERDGLHVWDPQEALALRDLLARASVPEPPDPVGALGISRPSGLRSLEVLVRPLGDREEWSPEPGVATLLVNDPEAPTEGSEGILRELFGLTPAEAALCRALMNGHSLAESSGRLGITRETARSRLKAVFAKTGTARQADLVRRLLTTPIRLP